MASKRALLAAARDGWWSEMKLLLDRQANVNVVDDYNQTPLHRASGNDHTNCVALLLERQANVNAVDSDKRTPLYLAAFHGHPLCVELLIAHGADRSIKNWYEETPEQRAKTQEIKQLIRDRVGCAARHSPAVTALSVPLAQIDLDRLDQALRRARDEIDEQRFMSGACRQSGDFIVSRVLGAGDFGMVVQATCSTPGFKWPAKQYALKVCFNFELDSSQARNAYINEFIELVKLPSHPNVIRFLCEFVDEIHDNIRSLLPPFARDQAIIDNQDGTQTNRKTQFFVIEFVEMSLSRLLSERFAPPSIIPHRMVATIISQVGSALQHLDHHRVAHRDIKTDNIVVDTREDPSTNEIEIVRCILIDFGASCRLTNDMKSIAVADPKWGNAFHIAPELHSGQRAAKRATSPENVELDYSRQSVFELGVLGLEIVNGCHPLPGYPFSVTGRNGVGYEDSAIAAISASRLAPEQAEMLRRAVSCDPDRRPSLEELIRCFDPSGELARIEYWDKSVEQ